MTRLLTWMKWGARIFLLVVTAWVTLAASGGRSADAAFQALLKRDDAAMQEVDRWIQAHNASGEGEEGLSQATLRARIQQRLRPVAEAYEDFLRRYPEHVRGRLAYGSFLSDQGAIDRAKEQWEKAGDLDPQNPAVWNNLANYYGEEGNPKKAFENYEKAIDLKPDAGVYYKNLGTTVLLYRKEAQAYFDEGEQAVIRRALKLFRKARSLKPNDFTVATDVARTFYGLKPRRPEEAMAAWREALALAHDPVESQGVRIHLARWAVIVGDPEAAGRQLDQIDAPMYQKIKTQLLEQVQELEDSDGNSSANE